MGKLAATRVYTPEKARRGVAGGAKQPAQDPSTLNRGRGNYVRRLWRNFWFQRQYVESLGVITAILTVRRN